MKHMTWPTPGNTPSSRQANGPLARESVL